jgi:hypothetical protein
MSLTCIADSCVKRDQLRGDARFLLLLFDARVDSFQTIINMRHRRARMESRVQNVSCGYASTLYRADRASG